MLKLQDTFRALEPSKNQFSRHYTSNQDKEGASRLDRIYATMNLNPISNQNLPNVFSNHFSYITKINVKEDCSETDIPKPKFSFEIKPKIIEDKDFQDKVKEKLTFWKELSNK